MRALIVAAAFAAPAALAAPSLESITASPNPAVFARGKAPEVQVTVTVKRAKTGPGNCEASVDFGDGTHPRAEDYGLSSSRNFRHTYARSGNYVVAVRGSGKVPCEGGAQTSLKVTGKPAAKKAEAKKKKGAAAPSASKP